MKYENKINARIVSKDGFGVRNNITFEAEYHQPITEELAMEAQTALGFIPAGYGFYNFKVTNCPVLLRSRATWVCQASCD